MVVRNSNIDISSWDTRQLISFLTKSAKEGEVVYSKPLDSFLRGDGTRDLFAHAALVLANRSFEVLPENAPAGQANIDLCMNEQLWEIKSPDGNTLRGVETAVRKAQRQFKKIPSSLYCPRLIFNARYHALDDAVLLAELRRRLEQHRFADALFVFKNGNVASVPIGKKPDVPISRTAGPLSEL